MRRPSFQVWLRVAMASAALTALPAPVGAQVTADVLRTELRAIGKLQPPDTVVARVGEDEVLAGEVNRLAKIAMRNRTISDDAIPVLEATALDEVIDKRLVGLYLDQAKVKVTEAEIDAAVERAQKNLTDSDKSFAEMLGDEGYTAKMYRDKVEWDLRWKKFLRSYLNDAQLEKYFQAHKQEFDGTDVRVSQILLRPTGPLDPKHLKELSERATSIRDAILGEVTTFEDAAKRESDAPSRAQGGDIGFIPRHGLMDDDFANVAFNLKKGEVSPPFPTRFGVHLIKCTEIRPGKKTWRDARKEVEPAAKSDAFRELAYKMRANTKIEYTGAIAHFNPEDRELVPARDVQERAGKPKDVK